MTRKQDTIPEEAETVIVRHGMFEVDPDLMKDEVQQQEMTDEERNKIVDNRWDYLEWMQDHFSNKILKPPEKYTE